MKLFSNSNGIPIPFSSNIIVTLFHCVQFDMAEIHQAGRASHTFCKPWLVFAERMTWVELLQVLQQSHI